MSQSIENKSMSQFQKIILLVLFITAVIIGLYINKDYGIAWDDHFQVEIGQHNYEFANGINDKLLSNPGNVFGAAFELPLYILQNLSSDFETQVKIRHLATHFYFLFSLYIFFKLLYKLFNSFDLALIGVFFLYLHPLLFAHSFFNTKDLPFLSTFIISIYTLYLLANNISNFKLIILHSFVSAFLIDIRLLGLLIPLLTVSYIILINTEKLQLQKLIKPLSIYFILLIMFIYVLWPALWSMPKLIFYSLLSMSHYPSSVVNIFNGELFHCASNPWHYIPIWITISTPIIVLLLYIYGLSSTLINFIKEKFSLNNKRKVLILILSSIPVDLWILFLIIKPSFYDGWRHLFFLSPLIVIGAINGFSSLLNIIYNDKYKQTFTKLFLLFFILIMGGKMFELHPYQQVYLNSFISKDSTNIRKNWEMDYWGLSYKEGFEKLLSIDSSITIKVKAANVSAIDNWKLVNEGDSRIKLVDEIEDADYYISNYRFHPNEYPYQRVYSINRQGSRILSIYKIKK